MDKGLIEGVLAFAGGVIVGAALCYGGYCLYQYYSKKKVAEEDNKEDNKEETAKRQRLEDLLANQIHVENLTAKVLTNWLRENKEKVAENPKMMIAIPTADIMRDLGCPENYELDEDTNVIQMLCDENGNVFLVRLVNYKNIDSNLQAKLLEEGGVIVVTD